MASLFEVCNEELVNWLQPGLVTVLMPRNARNGCQRFAWAGQALNLIQDVWRVMSCLHHACSRCAVLARVRGGLRLHVESGRVTVKGLHKEFVKEAAAVMRLLLRSVADRCTAETKLSMASSRSHIIFTLSR
jgi:hypothetical protein